MKPEKLLKNLKNSEFHNSNVDLADILQTHISFVAPIGRYVYKIKKSVNFGFLDFSTLEKRKYFCEEEDEVMKLCLQ